MAQPPDTDNGQRDRLERRLDKMVQAGRVSPDEAQRVRSAPSPAEFDEAVGAIRAQHAKARLDEAVAEGRLTEEEAAGLVRRLEAGEDPESLPALRSALRHGTERTSAGTDG